ncbi:MAG: hypothetical protein HY758_06900 [Nitrospirae bacterium]|nr:hypothetical protein [Nitrospirota bacterium]
MIKSEAERIYEAIFSAKIPESIQKHFEFLSKRIESQFTVNEITKYNECILNVHDLESLELAARCFNKIPILTLKFRIILYLSETLPENYPEYIKEKDNMLEGYLLLMASLVRTSFKLIKGIILLLVCRP